MKRAGVRSTLARGLLRAALLGVLAVGAGGEAGAQSSPRAAQHDGYGRLVFDWSGPVEYSAQVADDALVLRFDKAFSGDAQAVVKPLARYLGPAVVAPDRMSIRFPLRLPVQVKSFRSQSGGVVIDLIETKPGEKPAPSAAAADPLTPAPVVALPATVPAAPAAAPPPPGKPAAPPVDLMVRGGEHDGFNRLVFDWPKPVGHQLTQQGGQMTLLFDRPARVNLPSLKAALPADVTVGEIRPSGSGTALSLTLPPGVQARAFTSGPRVVVDLTRGAAPPEAKRSEAAAPAPAPPAAPAAAKRPDAPAPAAPVPAPTVPAPAGPAPTVPAAPLAVPPPAGKGPAPLATLGDVAAPEPAGKVVSLGFAFDKPTGAAVFRRAGWLWAVFDVKAEIDTKLLKRTGGDVVLFAEQIQGIKGSAIRLLTRPGFNPSVRKEGQLWVLDLSEQALVPRAPIAVAAQMDFEDRGRLVLAVSDGAPPMVLRDPEVGDTIQVVTVPAIGQGVKGTRVYPGLEILASAQGVAAIPFADTVRAEVGKADVTFGMPGGLYLTPPPPTPDAVAAPVEAPAPEAETIASGPLDIARWLRGGPDKFNEEHRRLLARLVQVRPADKNAQRMEIARHYLANGFGAEALGELRLIAGADPQAAEQPAFKAVRGAASVLMGRDEDAIRDLSDPALANESNVQLFLAAATARSRPDPARQALRLRLAADEIKGWPRTLRMTLGDVAARTVAGAGDGRGANRIIDAMMGPGLSKRDVSHLSYLGGLASIAGKQYEQAISRFRDAESGDSRPDRAHAARERIELMLRLGKITPDQAIEELSKLRFAWRGEDYEFQLMKRLGELQMKAGRYGEGLRSLHDLGVNYPDHPEIPKVMEGMREAFNRLFLDGEADKLSPITAIGLYDEFKELTPSGTQGDEMIRRLADRLASVDLLERAAELLHQQVESRLTGLEKAKVGARLAIIGLADRKPAQALEALDLSEGPDIPVDLAAQRRYLRVQALDDLGRAGEALALIINDPSDEARQLRGAINWRLKRWPDAAAAIESTIEKPLGNRPMEPKMARRVVDTATAMTLGRDERGLARLRRTYGESMAKTELREAFDLLTSEPERGIIDYRKIGDKIKQVEDFQTFIGEWKKRVKTDGVSSLN